MSDVVALATELLSLDSTSGHEREVGDVVARWLTARGWRVTRQEVAPGRDNIWAVRAGGGVTLSTHLDTVPPYLPPRLHAGRLYGRGACDAKGIAAAMMIAAQALVERGEERVDLLFVVGEEKGSPGARAANGLPATSRWLVNGEPTEGRLASGAKGALRLLVRVEGREAHSAYPELGRSALEPLLELLPQVRHLPLPADPVLGPTTCNIGVLRAGTEANIVPGRAEAELMIRLVGDAGPVRAVFDAWAEGRAELVWGAHIPAQRFHVIPGFDVAPVAYTSDIPLLDRWGVPLLYGPGSISVAHTPEENVGVDELRAAVDAYVRIVQHLLAEAA
jgi:acetylornithine deacetylase